ncbi:MAG: hypothetical protein APF81_00315 [Desulfosporosinus sp. BRH_c37]|nr:MAG: hypothetical protein APF81_00315 [Desulfosporosinus sp. BRH_c37]
MEINAGKLPLIMNNYLSIPSVVSPADATTSKPNPINVVKPEAVKDQQKLPDAEDKLTHDDIGQITDGLNKFMKTINADLNFEIHEETQRLMVQVVDTKDHRVIKEFPAHELLDTLAAISDYVGILLDKRV